MRHLIFLSLLSVGCDPTGACVIERKPVFDCLIKPCTPAPITHDCEDGLRHDECTDKHQPFSGVNFVKFRAGESCTTVCEGGVFVSADDAGHTRTTCD